MKATSNPPAVAPLVALTRAWATIARELAAENPMARRSVRLQVLLEGTAWQRACVQSIVDFVDYVANPADADVRMRVARSDSRTAGRKYTIAFRGIGRFDGIEASARVDLPRRCALTPPGRRRSLPMAAMASSAGAGPDGLLLRRRSG